MSEWTHVPSTFIIAEAGVNHNGSLDQAVQLIDAAVAAGADAVKFQTYQTEALVTQTAEQATYQADNTGVRESQFDMLKRLELSKADHEILWAHCQRQGIEFMSTAFDALSIDFLHQLGVRRWKIPSGELLSTPYLRQIAALNQPTILSTGMGALDEVDGAIKTLLEAGLVKNQLTVLHATSAYPTPFDEVNLRAMHTLRQRYGVSVGLSDHSQGIEVPIAAVALGASVIEKHFTLDKTMPGPDHKASLEPGELKQMVQSIRHIERALGSGQKAPTTQEMATRDVARKRIVARSPIACGERFSEANLTLKRASQGCFADQWDHLIGQKAKRAYQRNEAID
ncbi:N-acetylneuraminate synthase [Thiomicrospira sp. WB1]|uniref:N-acetylneuraminate synthase n=1 Tax=Thiomicrospira sp. WB1 TaxID=1685380 RepID=UPI000749FF00|nr:N-acetylneuraminate synthase [Thiomicrospira sp. WB1]KUJ71616.1 N-acetylneuraminate synthase [Thiomicrospira sp. WB1]